VVGAGSGVAISSIPGWAQDQAQQQTTDQKIQQLEQKVEALEKEVKADETTDGGQSAGAVSADYINGFTIVPRTATSYCTSAPICKSIIAPTTAPGPRGH